MIFSRHKAIKPIAGTLYCYVIAHTELAVRETKVLIVVFFNVFLNFFLCLRIQFLRALIIVYLCFQLHLIFQKFQLGIYAINPFKKPTVLPDTNPHNFFFHFICEEFKSTSTWQAPNDTMLFSFYAVLHRLLKKYRIFSKKLIYFLEPMIYP